MKKLIIIACSLFLYGCSGFAATPEEAVQSYVSKEDEFKIVNNLGSTSDNEKQGFYLVEAEVDNKEELVVIYVGCNDLYWYVKNSVHIPMPKGEYKTYSSQTDTFMAGLSDRTEDKKEGRMTIPIDDSDYYVWIERILN